MTLGSRMVPGFWPIPCNISRLQLSRIHNHSRRMTMRRGVILGERQAFFWVIKWRLFQAELMPNIMVFFFYVYSSIAYNYWWFRTFGLFSISDMGCHPSHWLSLHHFSRCFFLTTNQYIYIWPTWYDIWVSRPFCYSDSDFSSTRGFGFLNRTYGDCILHEQWMTHQNRDIEYCE